MKSTMRTEIKLEAIYQDMTRGLVGVTQGLEGVRRDVSALRVTTTTNITHCSREYRGTASNNFDRNVVIVAESTPSTSTPILRSPNIITEDLMTTAYIKVQINHIAMTVKKMSTLPIPNPNSVMKFHISPSAKYLSKRTTHLRHHVVREVTLIRDLLENDRIHIISIHDGAGALNDLSVHLAALDMDHESILVGTWAITLNRMLIAASGDGEPHLCAHLAFYLLNQSIRYDISDDKTRSLQAVEEAYTIAQDLQNQYGRETNFKILRSKVLLQYALQLVDHQRSMEMSIKAVQVLEGILNAQALTWSNPHGVVEVVVHHSSFFLDCLSSPASPITAAINYAGALRNLAFYLTTAGHYKSAVDLELFAILVFRKIVSIHRHEYRAHLALALASLVVGVTASHMSAEELVNLADECIQLLRELAEINPLFYARRLANVLCAKADTLEKLNRDTEAITA